MKDLLEFKRLKSIRFWIGLIAIEAGVVLTYLEGNVLYLVGGVAVAWLANSTYTNRLLGRR